MQKKRKGVKKYDRLAGFVFVLPFLIGFIFLFARPMLSSIYYMFNDVIIEPGQILFEPIGLENFRRMLGGDRWLIDAVLPEFRTIPFNIVMIMIFSMFIALLLNDKFPGRLFFRAVLFLPVIFGSRAIYDLIYTRIGVEAGTAGIEGLRQAGGNFDITVMEIAGFVRRLMEGYRLPDQFQTLFFGVITNVVSLVGSSGIQIILLLLGLQSVPSYLYEVSVIEGATKWEVFWKITFQLLTPSILLGLIFTIINEFNHTTNNIVLYIEHLQMTRFSYAATVAWAYSAAIFLLVGIVYFFVGRRAVYLD